MGKSQNDLIKLFLLLRVDSSSAINVVGDVNVVGFLFHSENYGKQLQIVKSQHY